MDIRKIIIKPLVTEKATQLKEKENKYMFMVEKNATKSQIKESIENLFNVEIESVHTVILPGKLRRMGAHAGMRPDYKKAMVKLKKGQEITIAEEVK